MAPMKIEIPEGYELLVGRSRENAIKAISLAEERGLDSSVVRTTTAYGGGYFIPLGDSAEATDEDEAVAEVEEIVFPDAEKASHKDIDAFAAEHGVTYDDIEAKDAEKPTKAEKVAHIVKVVTALAEANDAHLAETGEANVAPGAQNQEGD